jgi:hypothetical protein
LNNRPMFLFRSSLMIGAAILFPALASPASVSVNGTCDFNCSSTALTPGQSTGSVPYNFNVTLADGDKYNIAGTFSNSFPSGTNYGFFPTVTYVGTTPTVAADVVTVDMIQTFSDPALADPDWSGTYSENIPFILTLAGTSASGQLLIDGDSVGLLTVPASAGAGAYDLKNIALLSGITGNPLTADYQLSFTFPDLTPTGTGSGSPPASIPEPAETMLLGLGSLSLLLFKARKFSTK